MADRLPDGLKDDPGLSEPLACRAEGPVAVMHRINRPQGYETNSNDHGFSRMTTDDRWIAGREDAAYSLAHPDWTNRTLEPDEVITFDLAGDRPRER